MDCSFKQENKKKYIFQKYDTIYNRWNNDYTSSDLAQIIDVYYHNKKDDTVYRVVQEVTTQKIVDDMIQKSNYKKQLKKHKDRYE